MKKFLLAAAFCILPALLFAQESRKFFGFQFALGSGYTFYGDSGLKSNMNRMMDRGYGRLILYTDAGITLKLTEEIYFLAGLQVMGDSAWKGNHYSNHLSPAFFGGIQFYPGIANLSFSLAYALGFRRDWDVLPDDCRYVPAAKWGNGFRLAAEYDFKKGGGIIPCVGACYLFMPTGHDDYDNTLAVYFRLAFR